mgnify:CR=1 FL=1|tara:strand:+ start:1118 stop:1801 length:684 start_codon:yes stop_codon:yes gene_type:complete
MTNVLAFTASHHRPLYLRHCVIQLKAQSYTCSHGIYINAATFQNQNDSTNYTGLLSDLVTDNIKISYGKQQHQHWNHINALQLFDLDQFDLFLKIDDDDLYRTDYVKHIVEDYLHYQWDFSGIPSTYLLQKDQIKFIKSCFHKDKSEATNTQLDQAMPGTYCFSRKAIQTIIDVGQDYNWTHMYEDAFWLKWICESKQLVCRLRDHQDYTYNMHGQNFCKSRFKTVD